MKALLMFVALWEPRDPAVLAAEDCQRAMQAGQTCEMTDDDVELRPVLNVGDCFEWCPPPPLIPMPRDFRAEIIAEGEAM